MTLIEELRDSHELLPHTAYVVTYDVDSGALTGITMPGNGDPADAIEAADEYDHLNRSVGYTPNTVVALTDRAGFPYLIERA